MTSLGAAVGAGLVPAHVPYPGANQGGDKPLPYGVVQLPTDDGMCP